MRGWLSLQPAYQHPAYAGIAEVSVHVHPDHRRQGLGRRLVNQSRARAAALGIKSLVAIVFAHNLASLALFEQAGFARWGRLVRVLELGDGEERDVDILGARIDGR